MPKIVDRKSKEAHIIEAAIRCIEKQGMSNLSIAAIAAEAKVSTGVIYHYFNNKNDLLVALLKYVFLKSAVDVRKIVDPLKSPRKKIFKHLERMIISNMENPRLPTIQFAYMSSLHNNPNVARILSSFIRQILSYIESYLQQGRKKKEICIKNIEAFAVILLIIAYGAGVLWTIDPEKIDLDSVISTSRDMIIKYLESEKEDI